jgi:hypothetical protein
MSDDSAGSLKSVEWFPGAPRGGPERSGVGGALVKLAVGGLVGFLFFAARKPTMAYVVWGVGGTVGLVSLASRGAREAIDGALLRFGRWLGTFVGAALLGAVYLLFVTPLRLVRRLFGADDLHLRDRDRPSYWLPADSDERKVRWVGSMFATEARSPKGGSPLLKAFVALALLVLLAEGVLRTRGFGHAVLYVADPVVGYYTAPSMNLDRYGGRVRTNRFGMRSDEVEAKKPPGVFRILMLGDSTLYGGSYLDQDDLYSTRLVTLLDQRKGGAAGKVEILAMGVNGWGPFHERGYVRKFGTFEADLAIINMPVDDINRPHYGLMSVPFFSTQNPPSLALEEVANHFMWRYRWAHAGLDEHWEATQSQIGIREYGGLVDDLRRSVPEVIAAILPSQGAGMGLAEAATGKEGQWLAQLRETFAQHGARTYYAKGYFAGKGAAKELYHDDVHLDAKGHHIYAEFLADRLLEDSEGLRRFTGRAGPSTSAAPVRAHSPDLEKP